MNIVVTIYLIFGWLSVVWTFLILIQCVANWHYIRKRILQIRPPHNFTPSVDLICPCCGIDHDLKRNLRSLLQQDYPDYRVIFTVADRQDAAVPIIEELIKEFGTDHACLVVSGRTKTCSQKLHNLLQAIKQGSGGAALLAFVDSDINPESGWLRHLVDPLYRPRVGMVTGYRWYVPIRQNLPTITLSALNAVPGSFLGQHSFNHAWGGTMALRREYFDELKIADIWYNAITDDLTMSAAVKNAGYKVAFEPKCYSASRDHLTWSRIFEFVRRQFIITRVCRPMLWLAALAASVQNALALWLGLALTIWAAAVGHPFLHIIWPIPAIFYAASVTKGILRRTNVFLALPAHRDALNLSTWADIIAAPLINFVMLFCITASAFSNTIVWRGTKYRTHGPNRTEVLHR